MAENLLFILGEQPTECLGHLLGLITRIPLGQQLFHLGLMLPKLGLELPSHLRIRKLQTKHFLLGLSIGNIEPFPYP